ncbi:MAG: ABC transporter substrate-binding protein [Candidatus Binatia bacterium]
MPSYSLSVIALRIAQAKGMFQEEGLAVTLIQMKTNITISALTTKNIDYATASVAAMRSAISGLPIKTVMFMVQRPLHVLVARPEIRTIQELKGKILSIGAYGDLTDFILRAILAQHQIDRERDVNVFIVSGSGARLAALLSGKVDAAILPPPFNVKAEHQGLRRLAAGADFYEGGITGLSVHTDKLRKNPQQIRKMIRAVFKAHAFMKSNKSETIQIMSEWLKLEPSVAVASYEIYLRALSPNGLVSDRALMLDVERTRETLKIKEDVPLSRVVDFTNVRETLQQQRGAPGR